MRTSRFDFLMPFLGVLGVVTLFNVLGDFSITPRIELSAASLLWVVGLSCTVLFLRSGSDSLGSIRPLTVAVGVLVAIVSLAALDAFFEGSFGFDVPAWIAVPLALIGVGAVIQATVGWVQSRRSARTSQ